MRRPPPRAAEPPRRRSRDDGARRRGIEGDPAHLVEVDLDPGVGVPLTYGHVAAQRVPVTAGEAIDHPRVDTRAAQQQDHGRGEVFAVAAAGHEEELVHGIVGRVVLQVEGVAVVGAQVALHGEGLVKERLLAAGDRARQLTHAGGQAPWHDELMRQPVVIDPGRSPQPRRRGGGEVRIDGILDPRGPHLLTAHLVVGPPARDEKRAPRAGPGNAQRDGAVGAEDDGGVVQRLEVDLLPHGVAAAQEVGQLLFGASPRRVVGPWQGQRSAGRLVHHQLQVVHLGDLPELTADGGAVAPGAVVVVIEGGPAPAQRLLRATRGEDDAHHHTRIVTHDAVVPQAHLVREAHHGHAAPLVAQEQAEADARKEHEDQRRHHQDPHRDQRGAGQEAPADDAPGVEDPLHLDLLALGAVGVLEQVVLLHLPPQVQQRQGPGGEEDEQREADGVGEVGVEGGGHHHDQEADHVGLLVVLAAAAVEELVDQHEEQEVSARGDHRTAEEHIRGQVEDEGHRGHVPHQVVTIDVDAGGLGEPAQRDAHQGQRRGQHRELGAEQQGRHGGEDHQVGGQLVDTGEAHQAALVPGPLPPRG